MQKVIHPAEQRGKGEYGWLHTRYSFSFADWYEPSRMGFGALRVLNDDVIDPKSEFASHSHANMEIITIVTEGVVSHKDSMGNSYDIPAGEIQVMSAGTGVTHSESNNSPEQRLALFQIWIEPRERNIPPAYAQKPFGLGSKRNAFELLVSGEASSSVLKINQNAHVLYGEFDEGKALTYSLNTEGHGMYIFVIDGKAEVAGEILHPRDAIGIWESETISISFLEVTRVLLFEVPMT
jgi:redox-sensitive bicupin YhaK (pirin superfamily)